jgi:phosphohistidine phosphatase
MECLKRIINNCISCVYWLCSSSILNRFPPKTSKYKGNVSLTDSLYAAGPDAYIDVLSNLQDKYNTVLVIGHNPGLEELVKILSGEEYSVMPTCALAHVRLDIQSWSDIVQMTRKGTLVRLWNPHELS